MNTQELIKKLKKNQCYILRHGSRHDVWYSEITGKQFTVPRLYKRGGHMNTQELIKKLKKNQCYILRHGSRHDVWYSEITGKQFTVPRHKTEVPIGTANNILKDAGLK